jgi:hypothetical protein
MQCSTVAVYALVLVWLLFSMLQTAVIVTRGSYTLLLHSADIHAWFSAVTIYHQGSG